MLVFEEWEKPEKLKKNLKDQGGNYDLRGKFPGFRSILLF